SSCASNAHTDECSEPLVPSRPVEPAPTHHSPFTIHHSPFTIHHSPFTIHHSPFTIHHSPFTIHHSPFTIHHSAISERIPYGKIKHKVLPSPVGIGKIDSAECPSFTCRKFGIAK